ncbi:hypothetical protein ACVIJ6_001187 [Bradyrhizobium sp. USDA 4369]
MCCLIALLITGWCWRQGRRPALTAGRCCKVEKVSSGRGRLAMTALAGVSLGAAIAVDVAAASTVSSSLIAPICSALLPR